jgi:DNA-binding NtrC family response regulator
MALLSEPSIPAAGSSDAAAARGRAARVLVVDPEPALRRALARTLLAEGFDVLTAEDGHAALALLESNAVDVVLLDVLLPRVDGAELLAKLRAERSDIEAVVMATAPQHDAAVAAVERGAHAFVCKPFASDDDVIIAVSNAAERKRLVERMRALEQRLAENDRFGEIVGGNRRMREVRERALAVAPTSSAVLLVGESGTGKELFARTIHRHSGRAGRAFVALDCAALPPELVEGELFGVAREAGRPARVGLIETADRGTLFLDEIGALPPAAQARLVAMLQTGEARRVGADEPAAVDVRVIAATRADLKPRVTAGGFREDLFYRLNVVAIHLPPLRQRRDDVALLAYHFLRRHTERLGRDVTRIGPEALRALRERPWPGNVRELEYAIEHAVATARGGSLVPRDLPQDDGSDGEGRGRGEGEAGDDTAADASLPIGRLVELPYAEAKRRALEAFDRAFLGHALRRAAGNVSEAARRTGLDRSNFRRAVKRAKLE